MCIDWGGSCWKRGGQKPEGATAEGRTCPVLGDRRRGVAEPRSNACLLFTLMPGYCPPAATASGPPPTGPWYSLESWPPVPTSPSACQAWPTTLPWEMTPVPSPASPTGALLAPTHLCALAFTGRPLLWVRCAFRNPRLACSARFRNPVLALASCLYPKLMSTQCPRRATRGSWRLHPPHPSMLGVQVPRAPCSLLPPSLHSFA